MAQAIRVSNVEALQRRRKNKPVRTFIRAAFNAVMILVLLFLSFATPYVISALKEPVNTTQTSAK